MSHEQFEKDLIRYFYGELSEKEEQEFKSHLSSCPACQKELFELKAFSQTLEKAFAQEAKKKILERIQAKAEEEMNKASATWLKRKVIGAWAIAVLAMIAIGISLWWLLPERKTISDAYLAFVDGVQLLEQKFPTEYLIAYEQDSEDMIESLEQELEGLETAMENDENDFYQLEVDLYQIEIMSQGIFEI